MHADNFKLADYLARIGFEGEARADVATLNQIIFEYAKSLGGNHQ